MLYARYSSRGLAAGLRGREVAVLRFLRAVIALAVLLGIAPCANDAARAVEAINVRVDASAIDLTEAVERIKSEGDRIQVSTGVAAGARRRCGPPHRGGGARGGPELGGVRPRQQQRRADRSPDRGAALSHGGLRSVVAGPRPAAHG